jgi:hypothetical protein
MFGCGSGLNNTNRTLYETLHIFSCHSVLVKKTLFLCAFIACPCNRYSCEAAGALQIDRLVDEAALARNGVS